ncbi:hypothetical protein HALG_00013 [Halorubrum virus CGphi46]|uniref:CxxC motif protein n=1 Tax=Halorubrum virus CGphi46 TaxID=754066 RepID=R9TMJ9_9CAUD|nr:hypothetical protein HALG_00013 [Halorubrum virus CGphi46]AGN33801.1 hypothetical protein HALG_00013 [Halorubrum virus CGphi46]
MPEHTDYAKIHEGCGGVVRWVEAVDVPGVGWQGECLHCGDTRLPLEAIMPIRGLDVDDALDAPRDALAELQWDDGDTWRHNQKRLGTEVERLVA